MEYSIVIPNYNGRKLLETCLSSLLPQVESHESVILVDNGSTDGSREMIQKQWPGITSVFLESNTGFTGANNIGAAVSDSEIIILLNNDTRVASGWIDQLLKPLKDESAGAVTSSMRIMGKLAVMDSAGGQIDSLGYSSDIARGDSAEAWQSPAEILFPCGGAMAVRRKALDFPDEIFWEKLFLYNEDEELGFRLWKKGYRILYQPSAVVEHSFSATSGSASTMKSYFGTRNRILVLRRHLGEEFSLISGTLKLWEILSRIFLLAKGDTERYRAVLKGAREGFGSPVDYFGSGEKGCRLFRRFMVPTGGSLIRRKLGEKIMDRMSGFESDRFE